MGLLRAMSYLFSDFSSRDAIRGFFLGGGILWNVKSGERKMRDLLESRVNGDAGFISRDKMDYLMISSLS